MNNKTIGDGRVRVGLTRIHFKYLNTPSRDVCLEYTDNLIYLATNRCVGHLYQQNSLAPSQATVFNATFRSAETISQVFLWVNQK